MTHKQHSTTPFCLVIGSGSGGLTVAIGLAKAGKEVVLVERGEIGGDCTNTGCIPSKSLIHQASIAHEKGSVTNPLEYVRAVRQHIRDEEAPEVLRDEYGITVVHGTASFLDKKTVSVTLKSDDQATVLFQPRHIVVATGSRPRHIEISGLPKAKFHTSDTIFELASVPKKLVVFGAGPIGVELSQAYSRLGAKVHMLSRSARILSREDEASTAVIVRALEQDGVTIHREVGNLRYERGALLFESQKNTQKISGVDAVLVAAGRVPNIEDLNLSAADILHNPAGIIVDERYRTSVNNTYAIGDVVCGQPNFTHVANAQGRSLILTLLARFIPQKSVLHPFPAVTFSAPELATVGMSMAEIAHLHPQLVDKIQVPLATTDRGKTDALADGHVIVWAEKVTGKILRATIVADAAGEMITTFTTAMRAGTTLWGLSKTIFPYPTLAEGIKKAADTFVLHTLSRLKSDVPLVVSIKLRQGIAAHGVKLFALLFWLLFFVLSRNIMAARNLDFFDVSQLLADYLSMNPLGPLVYTVAYILRPFVLFPATLLAVLAGYAFGLQMGYVWGLTAGALSSLPFYYIGRYSNSQGESAQKSHTISRGILSNYLRPISQQPFTTVLILRFLSLPYDVVNFACGRYGAPAAQFFFATLLANTVGTFAYVALGASIEGQLKPGSISINPRYFLISIGLLILSIIASKLVRSRQA